MSNTAGARPASETDAGPVKAPCKPYHSPRLKVYGDVGEITASSGQTSPVTDPTAPPFCNAVPNYPGCRTS